MHQKFILPVLYLAVDYDVGVALVKRLIECLEWKERRSIVKRCSYTFLLVLERVASE